jgi:curved DNA-binding protein CbpA
MGNGQSTVDPVHLRIYSNIIQIHDPVKRVQMINTCLASMEYVTSAKRSGVYSYLLNYVAVVNSSGKPPLLPGEQQGTVQYQQPSGASVGLQVPRALQPNFNSVGGGIGATHPSLIDKPTASSYSSQQRVSNQTQMITHSDNTPSWKVITDTPKQKAMTYFASCLEVLGIQEEVALTEEALKSAYKKMALKAHPDKGGSEEYFEAVTRAYAYLSEILKHMKGGRKDINGRVDAPTSLNVSRDADAEKWKHVEPVRLNAKNLDMNAFNKLFEQTHIPDPDADGYGDWLKDNSGGKGTSGPKFGGQFNRDVFNRMFEDEAKTGRETAIQAWQQPQELTLAVGMGVELGRDRPTDYTAAPNSKNQFTDLRAAYTSENTVSNQIQGVRVDNRDFNSYKAQRERAPDAYNQSELAQLQAYEAHKKAQEDARRVRAAQEQLGARDYFDRMKQLVITQK